MDRSFLVNSMEVENGVSPFILYFVLYALAGTAIALLSRRARIKSSLDYYIGGKRIGGILAGATYAATTYSAFMMIGLVGMTYATGAGALGFELSYLISTVIILSTFGFEVWKLSRYRKWISPSEMIGDLYDFPLLSKMVSLIYLFAMVPYITAQIEGLGVIFQLGGMSYESGILASAIITAIWIALAGIWSVATTDLYNAFIMLIGGFLFFFSVLSVATGSNSLSEVLSILGERGFLGITQFWSFPVFLSYSLPWIFFAVTNPQVLSRLFIQKDERSYKISVTFFAFFGILYTILSVSIGFLARYLAIEGSIPSNLGSNYVTPALLSGISSTISAIVGVSIIAAAVSTADGIILSLSSSLFRDLLGLREKSTLFTATIDVLLTAVASFLAYLKPAYIVELSVLTSVLLLPLAPISIFGIWLENKIGRFSKISSGISLVFGIVVALIGLYLNGANKIFTSLILGLPLSAWVILISTAILGVGIILDLTIRKTSISFKS
ncbi:MAG: sodium:solute symporter family protein [Fervidicoccaceae archaeon]